jgi:hypothetical protein
MQLPLTTNGLVPVGVGVVVAIALVLLILFALRRRRPIGATYLEGRGMRDWAGAEPHHALAPPPPAMPAVQWSTGLAAVAPSAHTVSGVAPPPAHHDAPVPGPRVDAPTNGHPESAATTGSEPRTADGSPVVGLPTAGPGAAVVPPSVPVKSNTSRPLFGSDDAAARSGMGSRSNPADSAGSGRTVAAAVAQAFAARAAAARNGRIEQAPGTFDRNASPSLSTPSAADPSHSDPSPAGPPVPAQPSSSAPHSDVRDRLLAVLLDDPARAVGATAELVACRSQLQDVLHRLATSGLRPEQLARLVELPVEEVRALLASAGSPTR